MQLQSLASSWIEQAWLQTGKSFEAFAVPVARYVRFDVDDLAFPFRNSPLETWMLEDGILVAKANVRIARVPYVAFCLDDARKEMHVQVQWAPRCGYGYDVAFGEDGSKISENMRWVS